MDERAILTTVLERAGLADRCTARLAARVDDGRRATGRRATAGCEDASRARAPLSAHRPRARALRRGARRLPRRRELAGHRASADRRLLPERGERDVRAVVDAVPLSGEPTLAEAAVRSRRAFRSCRRGMARSWAASRSRARGCGARCGSTRRIPGSSRSTPGACPRAASLWRTRGSSRWIASRRRSRRARCSSFPMASWSTGGRARIAGSLSRSSRRRRRQTSRSTAYALARGDLALTSRRRGRPSSASCRSRSRSRGQPRARRRGGASSSSRGRRPWRRR